MNPQPKRPRTLTIRDRVKVLFHQVDMMGVVHNIQYLYWFELGRFAVVDAIFENEPELKKQIFTPVVMNLCNYHEAARLGDELVVVSKHQISPTWTGRLAFTHTVSNARTKATLAAGKSEITIVHADTFKPVKEIPKTFWNSYQNLR